MLFFDFNEISSGNCDCFKLQIQFKTTYWMVPCMPVDGKMQNIAVTEKLHNFQTVITVSKTSHISCKLVSTEH